jgi:CubicO group peptidase (beta-lactamase class C family)
MQLIKSIAKFLASGIVLLLVAGFAFMFAMDPVLTIRLLTLNQGPETTVRGGEIIDVPAMDETQRTIDPEALDAAIRYGEETGSHALLVYRSGSLELEHYYPGHDLLTITPTQSMHKSVLAMLIGIAIDQGHIPSVDTPASVFLTEWANDERSKITIRQMLQQVSGIDFDSFSPNITSSFFQLIFGDNIRQVALNSGVLFPPDTEFDYNSVNPQALGILLERATGQSYADYLSSALWQHIGAPDATVVIDSEENGMARTFCCLQATARSWLNLGLLHLNDGKVADKQVVPAKWMRAIKTPGKIQANYGYLTWLGTEWAEYRYYNRKTETRVLHSEAFAAPDIIYFDGMGGQRVYIIPSARMIIVRTGALAMEWDDSKLPNILLRGMY